MLGPLIKLLLVPELACCWPGLLHCQVDLPQILSYNMEKAKVKDSGNVFDFVAWKLS